jgi:putative Holliday junction resolvase
VSGFRPGIRLGVDVGSVRVGVASCDPAGVLASPVETVARDSRGDTDLRRIADLAAELEVIEIVVGLPISLSGKSGAAAAAASEYAIRLAAITAPIPVRLVDERLSTVSAHGNLASAGLGSRARRAVVDQAAAVIILQSALDAERATGRPPGQLTEPKGGA